MLENAPWPIRTHCADDTELNSSLIPQLGSCSQCSAGLQTTAEIYWFKLNPERMMAVMERKIPWGPGEHYNYAFPKNDPHSCPSGLYFWGFTGSTADPRFSNKPSISQHTVISVPHLSSYSLLYLLHPHSAMVQQHFQDYSQKLLESRSRAGDFMGKVPCWNVPHSQPSWALIPLHFQWANL